MPLPDNEMPWPPPGMAHIYDAMALWDAWYVGHGDRLAIAYGAATGGQLMTHDHVSRYRGGVVGRVARWFWGTPTTEILRTKLHVPIAADICQASADLLFAEPPTITTDNAKTDARIADIIERGHVRQTLTEAAEVTAALGGSFIRVVWDATLLDVPFFSRVDADGAWPTFQWGRLQRVVFWREVARNKDGAVLRHLEGHETDASGIGWIFHGLYQGTEDKLGMAIPLDASPVTAQFAPLVNDLGGISTLTPGLDVQYIRNRGPQRRWRKDPTGCHLGRSDLDGIEPLMDAFDETYSSWMRDVRQAKARILAGASVLGNGGPGKGAYFDLDQELFTELPGVLPSRDGSGLPIEQVQFNIRVEEHKATAQQLIEDILRTSGYSTQTFGEDDDGGPMTATEVVSRGERSYATRDAKIGEWQPALQQLWLKTLAIDAAVFSSGVIVDSPSVVFADGVQESTLSLAQTAQALRTAEAASTKTLVQMVHKDWNEQQVDDEVELINAESSRSVPDPTTFGGDPADNGSGDGGMSGSDLLGLLANGRSGQ